MIFHENRLLDLILLKLEKILQNLSSAATVNGAKNQEQLRVSLQVLIV